MTARGGMRGGGDTQTKIRSAHTTQPSTPVKSNMIEFVAWHRPDMVTTGTLSASTALNTALFSAIGTSDPSVVGANECQGQIKMKLEDGNLYPWLQQHVDRLD